MSADGIKLVEFCDRMMGCGDDKKNNIKTTQEFVIEREIDHVKCLQCGQVHFVGKGLPLPEIGWCGCDNNARTS